ncbi:unnamed protein product [Ixodes hexagonus]
MWSEDRSPLAADSPTAPAVRPLAAAASPSTEGMARSPSHESFGTDLSLLSLSSLGSELGRLRAGQRASRSLLQSEHASVGRRHYQSLGAAPTRTKVTICSCVERRNDSHHHLCYHRHGELAVPGVCFGSRRPLSGEVLFEEESEVIRSCGALSSVLGLVKSFSTGDIAQTALDENGTPLRASVSELALCAVLPARGRLDYASRSCSTWVAVGDVSSTSQLPSPQGLPASTNATGGDVSPGFTAADLVRSVNKKVRQMYIRRRLLSTYKALERLTKSELDLSGEPRDDLPRVHVTSELNRCIRDELDLSTLGFRGANRTLSLTVKDVERDRGKPLTKFERNMMIFNWLQSLDENTFEQS